MGSKYSPSKNSRKRKQAEKNLTVKKFLVKPNPTSKSYSVLYYDTINDPKFIGLSPQAQILYFRFVAKCGRDDNSGHEMCKFPKSEYKRQGFTPNGFAKYKSELMKGGWIEQERTITKGAYAWYRLSDNWYVYYDKEVPQEKQYFDAV